MDDNRPTAARSSALPRPMSRLPTPRSTPAIRPSPSKDNLSASLGGEAKTTRLRPSASRERLKPGPSFGVGNFTNLPPPITSAKPTNSTPSAAKTLPRPRPTSYLPTSNSQPKFSKSTTHNAFSRLPRDPMAALPEQDSPRDQPPPSKLPGLRRQASASWLQQRETLTRQRTPSMSNLSSGGASSSTPLQRSPTAEDDATADADQAKTLKPPTSLAERTMETLSHLQPSPALRSRVSISNFFETEPIRSTTRPVSRRGSRPGSRRCSESSNPPPLPSFSRPGSSAGPMHDGSTNSSFSMQFHAPDTTPTRGRTMGTLMKTPSTVGLNGNIRSQFASPSSARLSRSRTPSPEKPSVNVGTPVTGSKTLSARTVQARPSLNGLSGLKRPSAPILKKTSTPVQPLRKGSSASQKSSTTASGEDSLSATSSATTMQSSTSGETSPQFKKSSAALREQIAKAKAAKRSAIQHGSIQLNGVGGGAKSPMIPTDNTFDFGLTDDPFNLKRDANSTAKVLQSRVATARTSGRLNIAAMGLKEIPAEVLNMYSLESIGAHDGSWAESIDLSRFVAADNELEMIDEALFPDVDREDIFDEMDAPVSIFGGLETLDLHGNMLISLPSGLRRLTLLTALNLSSNRLANNCLEVISQVTPLRDLKLGGNLLWGTLEPCFTRLVNLEILDLHGNNLQALPPRFSELRRLRILNIAENNFESLPFDILSQLPLTELIARKNKLTGIFINDDVGAMPALQNLDISSNQLTAILRPNSTLEMPALMQLCVSMNRIQGLPDVSTWHELITLTADENSINAFPDGFTTLSKLKSVDLSSNDIRTVPAEIARMDNLAMLRLSGNPLRDKKFVAASIEELKATLEARLSPPPSELGQYDGGDGLIAEAITSNEVSPLENVFEQSSAQLLHEGVEEDERTDTEDFATPPTSAPVSPTRARSSSIALTWTVTPGGLLDRSNTQSSSLHPVACAKLANDHTIREIQLHHNIFAALPDSLSFFAETLTTLSVAHNQLVGETYLPTGEDLDFPALKELNLSSNHITSLAPLVNHFHAPNLEKLDVSINRIAALPSTADKEKGGKLLKDAFPELKVLLFANNHIADLDPESIRGLKIVDAANNDIAHLNPRIGLLGGSGGLERLEVNGNRFRVPRWNVLERGTEATLRFLRSRVPVAEMASWRAERGVAEEDDVSDVD